MQYQENNIFDGRHCVHAYLFSDYIVEFFNKKENRRKASRRFRRRSESIRQFSAGLNLGNKSMKSWWWWWVRTGVTDRFSL